MTFLFYALGWLSILGGVSYGASAIFNATKTISATEGLMSFALNQGLAVAMPAVPIVVIGLVFLATAGVLSRLNEIAYNTRPLS